MVIAFSLAIGIPLLLVVIYATGRWKYGEKWYLVLGLASTGGDPDLAAEIEDSRITKLNLRGGKGSSQ